MSCGECGKKFEEQEIYYNCLECDHHEYCSDCIEKYPNLHPEHYNFSATRFFKVGTWMEADQALMDPIILRKEYYELNSNDDINCGRCKKVFSNEEIYKCISCTTDFYLCSFCYRTKFHEHENRKHLFISIN